MKQLLRTAAAVALLVVVAVPAALWAWPKVGALAAHTSVPPAPTAMDIVLVPHPGDEFQALSLVADDPSAYTVYVLLTRGEESRGANLGTWVEQLDRHGRVDESLPAHLEPLGERGPFPDEHNIVCRTDRGEDDCTAVQTAEVWTDAEARGAVVAFDLGERDLTRGEVTWAIQTVKGNREALGIDTRVPVRGLVGAAFANTSYDCVRFEDPDHVAVHKALYDNNYFVAYQTAPTCADDPDAGRSGVVSDAAVDVAFPGSDGKATWRIHGSFPTVDERGQRRPFHTHQEFWVAALD